MEVKVLWSDTSLVQLQDIFDYYNLRASTTVAAKNCKRISRKIFYPGNQSIDRHKRAITGQKTI